MNRVVILVVLASVALASCKRGPSSWKWEGIPEGVGVRCPTSSEDVNTCVGSNGVVYVCVRSWQDEVVSCGTAPMVSQ